MSIKIDRCICFQKTFKELALLAQAHQVQTLEALQQHAEFAKKCRLCSPYIRRMLQSGETVFHEILTEPEQN